MRSTSVTKTLVATAIALRTRHTGSFKVVLPLNKDIVLIDNSIWDTWSFDGNIHSATAVISDVCSTESFSG